VPTTERLFSPHGRMAGKHTGDGFPALDSRPAMRKISATVPARLSETAQALASVALAAYLVGLVLTIAGNSVSGSSALVRTIKGRLFSPWMQPAWLDLGFDHPLTYGLPEDAPHELELRSRGTGAEPMRLPGARSGERAARWRRLARAVAEAAAADAAAPLVGGVGAGAFAALGSDDVIVRVLRPPLPDREQPPADRRPRAAHAARVRRVAGELQVLELAGPAKLVELAPLLEPPVAQDAAAEEPAYGD